MEPRASDSAAAMTAGFSATSTARYRTGC